MGAKKKTNQNDQTPPTKTSKMQSILDSLSKLTEFIKPNKDGVRKKAGDELDNNALTKSLDLLKTAVLDITKYLQEDEKSKEKLEKKARISEDEADSQNQKNLRGKFIITSGGKDSIVKTAEVLKAEGSSPTVHAKYLAMQKYKVDIPDGEIASCYSLKSGGIVLSLWNQSLGSAFQKLVNTIKGNSSDKDVNLNVYFNFMLTRRRSGLLYDVRKLKKDGDIEKYFSDENGNISIQIKKENKEKKKVINTFEENSEGVKTLTTEEIKTMIQHHQ